MATFRVTEREFLFGNITRSLEDLSPQIRVDLVREIVHLAIRRKDDHFGSLLDILSEDWCPHGTPSPEEAVRRFVYTQHLPENRWHWAEENKFLVLAHHKRFPIPLDACSVSPDQVESEHLLLVRPEPKKEAELARWAIMWEPQLRDPIDLASTTEIWSLPLDWLVVKHELTILDDGALGEQLKKPHFSTATHRSSPQDSLHEIMKAVRRIEVVRAHRRDARYREDLRRSAQLSALYEKINAVF